MDQKSIEASHRIMAQIYEATLGRFGVDTLYSDLSYETISNMTLKEIADCIDVEAAAQGEKKTNAILAVNLSFWGERWESDEDTNQQHADLFHQVQSMRDGDPIPPSDELLEFSPGLDQGNAA